MDTISLEELTEDSRYKEAPIEKKTIALQRWFSDARKEDPKLDDTFIKQVIGIERLKNARDSETEFNRPSYDGVIGLQKNIAKARLEGATSDELMELAKTGAAEIEQAERARVKDFTDRVKLGEAAYKRGTVGGSGGLTGMVGSREELTNLLSESERLGMDDARVDQFTREARLRSGRIEGLVEVDSTGEAVFNPQELVVNPKSIRKAVESLGLAPKARERALARIEDEREQVINGIFERSGNAPIRTTDRLLSSAGDVDIDVSEDSVPLNKLVEDVARGMEKANPGKNKINEGDISEENLKKAREEVLSTVLKNEANRGIISRGFVESAAQIYGLQGLVGKSNTARDQARDIISEGRALSGQGTAARLSEGAITLLPQILVTRGLGTAAGATTRLSTAGFVSSARSKALAQSAATGAAIGYGGLQSAAGSVDEIRRNGGSVSEQFAGGVLGFLTTVGVTAGFNRAGLGGVEDFSRRVASSRKALLGAVAKSGFGEGAEEFTDELINGFINAAISNPDARIEDIAKNALDAGILGFGFGISTRGLRSLSDLGAAQDVQRVTPTPTASLTDEDLQAQADLNLEQQAGAVDNESEGERRRRELQQTDITDAALDIKYARGGPTGEFVKGLEFIAEASESVVYRDGDTVVKVSEPFNDRSEDTYQARVTNRKLIDTELGDGTLRLEGHYLSDNGTKNPIFRQDYVEGREASDTEIENHMVSRGYQKQADGSYSKTDGDTVYRVLDLTDGNVVVDSEGVTHVIDASITTSKLPTTTKPVEATVEPAAPKTVSTGSDEDAPRIDLTQLSPAEKDTYITRNLSPAEQEAYREYQSGKLTPEREAEVEGAKAKLRNDPEILSAVEPTDTESFVSAAVEVKEPDEQLLEVLREGLNKAGRTQDAQQLKLSTRSSRSLREAKKIGEFFGRRVVVVSGMRARGAVTNQANGVIYVSDRSDRSEVLVTYHELLHSFKNSDPSGYAKLAASVDADLESYVRKNPNRGGLNPDATKEEFLADYLADRATTKGFWDRIAEKEPALLEKFAQFMRSMIKRLIKGRVGSASLIRNLEKADAALTDFVIAQRLRAPAKKVEAEPAVKNEKKAESTAPKKKKVKKPKMTEEEAVTKSKIAVQPEIDKLPDTGANRIRKADLNRALKKATTLDEVNEVQQAVSGGSVNFDDAEPKRRPAWIDRSGNIVSLSNGETHGDYASKLLKVKPVDGTAALNLKGWARVIPTGETIYVDFGETQQTLSPSQRKSLIRLAEGLGSQSITADGYNGQRIIWESDEKRSDVRFDDPTPRPGYQPESQIDVRLGDDTLPLEGRDTRDGLDYETLKTMPDLLKRMVKKLRQSGIFRISNRMRNPENMAEIALEQLTNNILYVHDAVPKDIAERSKKWYQGANKIANSWAKKYGIPLHSTAAVIAALSPQRDWFMNVSLAERTLDVWSGQRRNTDTITPEMIETAERLDSVKQPKEQEIEGEIYFYTPFTDRARKLGDRPFDDMSPGDKAMFVRLYDETYNSPSFSTITPEGEFRRLQTGKTGKLSTVTWGPFATIEKAIRILDLGTLDAASEALGKQHKIRSFHNNIVSPGDPRNVTSDTHAVAVATLLPVAGGSPDVTANFSGVRDAKTGFTGTYALYAEAYRRAAKLRGIAPSEMQSITWEAIREVYDKQFKQKSYALDSVRAIWKKYANEDIDYETAREQAFQAGGGYSPPSWYQQLAVSEFDDIGDGRRESTYVEGDDLSPATRLRSRKGRRDGRTGSGRDSGTQEGDAASQGNRSAARAVQDELRFDDPVDPFYSQLQRTVAAKIPARATPDQIMATVKAAGVKSEEIKWSGIEQALGSLAVDGKVEKAALMKYLGEEGSVRFEEVVLGRPRGSTLSGTYQDPDTQEWVVSYPGGEQRFATLPEAIKFGDDYNKKAPQQEEVKFAQYVLPGGENYREVVLAMPTEQAASDVEGIARSIARNDGEDWNRLSEEVREGLRVVARNRLEENRNRPYSAYTSSHFPDVPNYVAHMRLNERTDAEGNPGLFIEEIQSDRHQAGRTKGYDTDIPTTLPEGWRSTFEPNPAYVGRDYKVVDEKGKSIARASTQQEAVRKAWGYLRDGDTVPDAPFRTTWPLALFKRALRDAVASGKDWIGWTVGETQNDRFDLSKTLESVDVAREGDKFRVFYRTREGASSEAGVFPAQELPDVVGKELADKIVSDFSGGDPARKEALKSQMDQARRDMQAYGFDDPKGEEAYDRYKTLQAEYQANNPTAKKYEGLDLKVGGSGMKGFYDNILPKEIGKYVDRLGKGKVEAAKLNLEGQSFSLNPDGSQNDYRPPSVVPIWRIDITPEMRSTVTEQGQVMFDDPPLEGLPSKVTVPGRGKITFGPYLPARQAAETYAQQSGIPYNPPKTYAKVDVVRAERIAAEFDRMKHDPTNPEVKAAFDAMIKETLAQWEVIKATGIKIEPIPEGQPDPYAKSPRYAHLDVIENNHLWFFPTVSGFGGTNVADQDVSGNPLMVETGEVINGHRMVANDVFRVVHDYFGHIKEGVGFRADGEENAWRIHSAMYSPLARKAMTTETRGQNSWVNFGPYAEFNKTAKGDETQYAPQKTGLLPDWVVSDGATDSDVKFDDAKAYNPQTGVPFIDGGKLTSRLNRSTGQPEEARVRFKTPLRLDDGTRISGFTDDSRTVFYGYDKNGEAFTLSAEYVGTVENPKAQNLIDDGSELFNRLSQALDAFNKSRGIRFDDPKPYNPRTSGIDNSFVIDTRRDFIAARDVIHRDIFDPNTVPLTDEGLAQAESFLASLLDQELMQQRQDTIGEEVNLTGNRSAAVAGILRSAYFAYAARWFKKNRTKARELMAMGMIVAEGVRAQLDEPSMSASETGALLASFKSYKGGSIVGLFAVELQSRFDYVKERFGENLAKLSRSVARVSNRTNPDAKTDKHRNKNHKIRKIVDEVLIESDQLAKLKQAEAQARNAWKKVASLLSRLVESGLKFDDPTMTPLQAFLDLVNRDGDLDDIAEAFEKVLPRLEARLQPEDLEIVRKTKRTAQDAEKVRENITGRSATKNPADTLAKRLIGRAKNFDRVSPKAEDKKKAAFDELMNSGASRADFIERFVAMGGSPELANELFDANQIRVDRQLQREAAEAEARIDKEVEKAAEKAQRSYDKAQEYVDRVGDEVIPARPTKDNDTYQAMVRRYISQNYAESDETTLTKDLATFTRPDGEQYFTDDQIDQIVTRAEFARRDRIAARAAKLEADYQKAQRRSRRAAEDKASKILTKGQAKDSQSRSITQIIEDEFINNPRRGVLDRKGRIRLAREILKERTDLDYEQIKRVAENLEKELSNWLEAAMLRAASSILKSLEKGKLSPSEVQKFVRLNPSQIEQAIRLQVFDPTKDFVTSIAALAGWEGLTGEEMARLTELEQQIDANGRTSRKAIQLIHKQGRIILNATGLSPKAKDLINSYIRGNIYSGTSSLGLSVMVGLYEYAKLFADELVVSIINSKGNIPKLLNEIKVLGSAWFSNHIAGYREARVAFRTGTSFTEQVQGGQEGSLDNDIFTDPLTRVWDRSIDDIRKGYVAMKAATPARRMAIASKLILPAIKAALSTVRLTFRVLGGIDAGITKMHSETRSTILAYRSFVDMGGSSAEYDAVQRAAEQVGLSYAEHARKNLGLTGNDLSIATQEAVQGAIFMAMRDKGVPIDKLTESAISEIQAKIGTGKTSDKTVIGQITNFMARAANSFPGGAIAIPAVRTVGNVIDEMLWNAPVVGMYRALKYRKYSEAERQKVFPNMKENWQYNRNAAYAYLSTPLTALITALLKANEDEPDDSKWFWFTGPYPTLDQAEQARWRNNGWDENTLIVGNTRIRLDRGFGQTFLFPVAVGRFAHDAMNGATPEEYLQNSWGLADLMVPGISQLSDRFGARESVSATTNTLEQVWTSFVPFASLMKTPRRLGDRIDKRKSENLNFFLTPFYVDTEGEGVVLMKNVLGQKLEQDRNPYGWVQKLGFPVYYRTVSNDGDPRSAVMRDFVDNNYRGGAVDSNSLKKKAGDRYNARLLNDYVDYRVQQFMKYYKPSRSSLLGREDYGSKVGALWSKATEDADRRFRLR